MRKFTKNAAVKEESLPLTVADMSEKDIFRIVGYKDWWRRSRSDNARIVSLTDGMIRNRGKENWGEDVVTEVLAPGESLTIGPEE